MLQLDSLECLNRTMCTSRLRAGRFAVAVVSGLRVARIRGISDLMPGTA